ncbi:hypothetical protein EGW08_018267 [Elysia chlorotica]|uniref:Uncharacterized protein n=1 Tax=Elysia chlorotica TaxID=188477 RepID=A0A3S0ZFZ2_ELYCH|nr:hypothetical protein EGW08_018267 [Elysia chlorotica]
MEARYSFDNTQSLRPRSKDFLRVKSEDLGYSSCQSEQSRKDATQEELQHQQHHRKTQNAAGSLSTPKHRHEGYQTIQTPQRDLHLRDSLTLSQSQESTSSGSMMLPNSKASICAPSVFAPKQRAHRKSQQRLTRQSVVEETSLGHGHGGRGNNFSKDTTSSTTTSTTSGVELLDRVEQLTRQLVRVCGGKRSDSVDMGDAAVFQINVPTKLTEGKLKSPNSSVDSSFRAAKKHAAEKNMSSQDREEDGTKEVNIQNLDVVEAPLKAFFLRNRNNTCSLRGGKKITGGSGEEAASLTPVVYSEEEKYPWGRRLEDAPWVSPIYSIRPGHRQHCTRCLTYFHFTLMTHPHPGTDGRNLNSQSQAYRSESVRSKRAKLHKMKSLQSKWDARKGQLTHTKSAPLSGQEESSSDCNRESQIKLRKTWAQYGQHSYDSRLASAADNDGLSNTPGNIILPPSNFLRPPLTEGEGLKLRQTEARRLASRNSLRDPEICARGEKSKAPFGSCTDMDTDTPEEQTTMLLPSQHLKSVNIQLAKRRAWNSLSSQ